MDPNNPKVIENYVRSLEKAAKIIDDRKPDCIIAPMFGTVPFIDVLNLINPQFPNDKVEYVPASSCIYRVKEVLRGAFEGIIENYAASTGATFLSIDEVVSGSSMDRVTKQFMFARHSHAQKNTLDLYGDTADLTRGPAHNYCEQLRESIEYNTIGIVQRGPQTPPNTLREEYFHWLNNGVLIPVETECIVTMDRTEFFPARYKKKPDQKGTYLPVVDKFDIHPTYIDFLVEVSKILGVPQENVTMRNMGKIKESYHWVPEHLRTMHELDKTHPNFKDKKPQQS